MKSVRVDPMRRIARAEGGLLGREYDQRDAGLRAGLARRSDWYLSRRYGMACDNLLSADIVTAGELITAAADSHPDLYWALRGSSGSATCHWRPMTTSRCSAA